MAKPDRLTVRFKTERLESFVDRLLVASVGTGSFAALALKRVAKQQLLPKVRSRTPEGETGRARAGWGIVRENYGARRPFLEVGNRVFYIRFLEFGTLARRKKKLKKSTMRRLRQKAAKGGRLSARRGGIRPVRMLGTSMRDLRAKNAVPEELKKTFTRSAELAKRQAERIAV